MNDHTTGVLEGLGYCLALVPKRSKLSQRIAERIVEIVEATARDLEFRMRVTA
jgi:hypothetical protein